MKTALFLLIFISFSAIGDDHKQRTNGTLRDQQHPEHVWHHASQTWATPSDFFDLEIQRLGGPTFGTRKGNQYPDYNTVNEWDTLIDELNNGSTCAMVFFHQRWRRLGDVLALSPYLRDFGGCKDVFNN